MSIRNSCLMKWRRSPMRPQRRGYVSASSRQKPPSPSATVSSQLRLVPAGRPTGIMSPSRCHTGLRVDEHTVAVEEHPPAWQHRHFRATGLLR